MKAYQLKITIKNSKPPIWRRCIVPAGLSFSQLTHVIREVMGWTGYHLSEYSFNNLKINLVENPEYDRFMWGYVDLDASEYIIDDFLETVKTFTYTYDFGDDWTHEVRIEAVLEDYDKDCPCVVKFKGDTPPEDCGGICGYYELMEALNDPKNPDHEEMKDWYGETPHSAYDMDHVNDTLSQMMVTEKKIKPITESELNDIYFSKGKITLDKVKGKTLKSFKKAADSGKGTRSKYGDEMAILSELFDGLVKMSKGSAGKKSELDRLLSEGIERTPDFGFDFDRWSEVSVEKSGNLIQDYLLNLREIDIDNFTKYLQLSVGRGSTKLSKIKRLVEFLSKNPGYYLFVFNENSLKVLFDIFAGKTDELGFGEYVPDDVAEAIQIASMLGLLHVKDKGKKCILQLAEDAYNIADSIKKVNAKEIYERLDVFDDKLGAVIRNYGFIEVDNALDMVRGEFPGVKDTKELKRMLYWHSRMMNMVTTGTNEITGETFATAPGYPAEEILEYRSKYKIDDSIDYKPLDLNDPSVLSRNVAQQFYCWDNLADVLKEGIGLDNSEIADCVESLFSDVIRGKSAAYIYDRLMDEYPVDDPFIRTMYWHAAFACVGEMALPQLKGYTKYEFYKKTGKYPEGLPMGEKLGRGKKIGRDTQLKNFPEEDQWALYSLRLENELRDHREESIKLADELLDKYPDNKQLLAYLPEAYMALDERSKAKEILQKLRLMDHSLEKEIKAMLRVIDSGARLPYFEDLPFGDESNWDFGGYVPREPVVRQLPKVGRNDPCPCGSGKKFKKCCMGKGIYD